MEAVTVYLGLGTNLGERRKNLERAAELFFRSPSDPLNPSQMGPKAHLQPLRSSSVYETAPLGYANQPDFLNCVLELGTGLTPEQLLDITQKVEREMGREWSLRYGPRVIDVDILFHGASIVDQPNLQIPHPRLHQRAFVLVPLAELAPELTHPALGLTVLDMTAEVDGKSGVKLLGPPLNLPRQDELEPQA